MIRSARVGPRWVLGIAGKSIEVCSDERARGERDNPKCRYEIVNEVDYEL
jgi:hypothetical protein